MNYVMSPLQQAGKFAAIKPKEDIADSLISIGFRPLQYRRRVAEQTDRQVTREVKRELVGAVGNVGTGDCVFYQTPTYAGFQVEKALVELLKRRGAKVVAILHDIEYVRFPAQYSRSKQIGFYNLFDAVLVATAPMRTLLLEDGVQVPILAVGPFDYRQDLPVRQPTFSRTLHYAGNLDAGKASYLKRVPAGLDFRVYGTVNGAERVRPPMAPGVTYYGAYTQTQLWSAFSHGFGLVWDQNDGEDEDRYESYGDINWSNKASMYLTMGLPIMTRTASYTGAYVREHGFGFTADSLAMMAERLAAITPSEYAQTVARVAHEAESIRSGLYFQAAAIRALTLLV